MMRKKIKKVRREKKRSERRKARQISEVDAIEQSERGTCRSTWNPTLYDPRMIAATDREQP